MSASTNDLELVGHQERPAKSISVHPRYSGTKRLYNDVAVIHLKEPYEISQYLNAIPLPESPGFMKLCFYVVHIYIYIFFTKGLFYLAVFCYLLFCWMLSEGTPKIST